MLRHLLAKINDVTSAKDLAKCIDLLDAIGWIKLAWDSVKAETIRKCFATCHIKPEKSIEEEIVELGAESQLLQAMEWEEFVAMDSKLPVVNPNSAAHDSVEEEEDLDEEVEKEPEPTISSQAQPSQGT